MRLLILNLKVEECVIIMMEQIYVSPYHDSENNDDCVVVYRNIHNTTLIHIANINLKQRFFIKADKSRHKVHSKDDTSLIMEDGVTCYTFESYFSDNQQMPDIIRVLSDSLQTPYRLGKQSAKIVFY
jgi:hypothetical protein